MMPRETIPVHDDVLPLVTVAVCTRDRAHHLDRCLTAIQRLTYPQLDVLLIDNAPLTDATKVLVENRFPHVRYRVEPRPGLDWARNRAVVEAGGDIIAFTDDDVVVDPGWVDALVRVFAEDPHIMAVTGLVAPCELETESQILFEKYGGFGKGFKRKSYPLRKEGHLSQWSHLAAGDIGTGANMAFRRSVFGTIGLFDPALDTGTPTGGGGDLEMFFRVVQEGHALVYEPKAVVRHIHRREYRRLKAQIRSWGTAFMAYLTRSAMAYPKARPMIVCFALRWLVGRHLIRPFRHLLAGRYIPPALVWEELRGSISGVYACYQAVRQAKRIEARFGPMASHIPLSRNPIGKTPQETT
jgi:O-antigen biosynthesis protein